MWVRVDLLINVVLPIFLYLESKTVRWITFVARQ